MKFKYLLLMFIGPLIIDSFGDIHTASVEVTGTSFSMGPAFLATPQGTAAFYFTTYDGFSGYPLHDSLGNTLYFSEEFSPASPSGTYQSDFVAFLNGLLLEYGSVTASFGFSDANGNGLDDFLEFDREANVSFGGSVTDDYPRVAVTPLTGQLSRPKGQVTGSYRATVRTSPPSNYSGTWSITHSIGSIVYTRGPQNTFSIDIISTSSAGMSRSTGTGTFSVISQDFVLFNQLTITSDSGQQVTVEAFTLSRSGDHYRGFANLFDGNTETSWADYRGRYIDIRDSNDQNSNGVPDLTDNSIDPPTIIQQPDDVVLQLGLPGSVRIATGGGPGNVFQWYFDGQPISQATDYIFTFSAAYKSQEGRYRLRVRNGAGMVDSREFRIFVNSPPYSSLSLSGSAAQPNESITITASALDSDDTISAVQFFDGSTLLQTISAAPFQLEKAFSIGLHSLTCKAMDSRGGSSTSIAQILTVRPPNRPPSVVFGSLPHIIENSSVLTLTAFASDSDGGIASVTFYTNDTVAGTVTLPPYRIAITNLTIGELEVRATAQDNLGALTTSVPFPILVISPPRFTNVFADSDLTVHLGFLAAAGIEYVLEESTDAVVWRSVSTNVSPLEELVLAPDRKREQNFYRLLAR